MFEAEFTKIALWTDILTKFEELMKNATLHFSHKGVLLESLDTDKVTLLRLFWSKRAFPSFKCSGNATLVVNLKTFNVVCEFINLGDTIQMKQKSKHHLQIMSKKS